MPPIVVAMTGASGQSYGVRLVQALLDLNQNVALTVSDAARLVMKEELGMDIPLVGNPVEVIIGKFASRYVHYLDADDVGAGIASGSFRTQGMVICPCSTGTLGSIAAGVSRNLVERAAEVTLKERRKLVMVVRETPLSTIQLENMHRLSMAGAVIMPASPGFYHNPESVDDMVDFMIARILDQLGIHHSIGKRWKESKTFQS